MNDRIDLVVCHKYLYDWYDLDPPFEYGNNSPDGDDNWTTGRAGAYFLSEASYRPILSYELTPIKGITIKSGNLKVLGGSVVIK